MSSLLARLRPDLYVVLILAMVVVASLLPATGVAAEGFDWATTVAIGLVFFLHGARLSRDAVIAGMTHWRLHLLVLSATFVLFPVLGLAIAALPEQITPASLAAGVILLGCLPSTVQSSIGFTAIARGNVAAAVAAATASNLIGVVLTPLLVGLTLHAAGGGLSLDSMRTILLQLLAPFIAGQVLRRWVGPWIQARAKVLSWVDKGAILLVVYTAFSEAVAGGLWRRVDAYDLARLLAICVVLLAVVLTATTFLARALKFSKEDEIAIVFCGSKKSLASGVPMASVLFPAAIVGPMLLPLMIFHQIQLMACAVIAQRYAARPQVAEG
jgi:sodium/bile acid cotransporter 7